MISLQCPKPKSKPSDCIPEFTRCFNDMCDWRKMVSDGQFARITFNVAVPEPRDVLVEFSNGSQLRGLCLSGDLVKRERSMIAETKMAARKERVVDLLAENLEAVEQILSGSPSSPAMAVEAPEFFLSLEDAAKYAGVSERTIQNWKKREWLKVEQNGRKIRISRADLEKCMNKQ